MLALQYCLLLVGIVFLIGCLDDLVIDVAYAIYRIKPKIISRERWAKWKSMHEKPLAIMIPAWQESSVLEAMVKTNLKRIQYKNYRWYLGVYPNDEATVKVAKSLEERYPDMVTVVVTDRPGPTSKAHCLNCILAVIEEQVAKATREGNGWIPHYVAIHDAEDVIHPQAFRVINGQRADTDFIQVPIFSLPVPLKSWVAGTYLDEFAEIHLKDMPIREKLKLPIPSAGVGTFFSYRMISLLGKRFGYWFDEKILTEDYEIALRIARLGGKQKFLLIKDEAGEIIATREYFPDEFKRSIRQKIRWTTGMSFQTIDKWGAFGATGALYKYSNIATFYALWRDRKAIWANPSVLVAWTLMIVGVFVFLLPGKSAITSPTYQRMLQTLLVINASAFSLRIFQRARFCGRLYGIGHGLLAVPRVILSNVINCAAAVGAYRTYFSALAKKQQTAIKWDKTDHKFPTLEALESK
jgi:adsorption protein B